MKSRRKKFFSYYKPYIGVLLMDMACAMIVSVAALLLPLCTRYITGKLMTGSTPALLEEVYRMGIFMLALIVLHTVCGIFVDSNGHAMGAMMEGDMREELFAHYQKLSFSFYDEQKIGQLMACITNDTLAMAELYHHGPEDIVISFIKFIGVFVILMRINLRLTLLIFLFLPVMVVYALFFNKKMHTALRKNKDRIGDINAQLEDTLSGIREVASYTNEAFEIRKFSFLNARFVKSRKEGYRSEAFFDQGVYAFAQAIVVAVIVFGAAGIGGTSLNLADLLTFLLCVNILFDPIQRLINFTKLYQEGITGFARFMDVLEKEPDIGDREDACTPAHVQGRIQFKDVSFRYPGQQQYVLRNVSLDICPGEFIALVGTSGVGKTTLCSLIPRFYDVSAGKVLLDGIDVRQIKLHALRKYIGIVRQDMYLLNGTVAEAIRYGRLDASREEIVAAAKKANAHDFILSLPRGYDTELGQRGVRLSGGQKQRLCIARVFLKDPPILIFDEATSALDNESETAVYDSLREVSENRTTLVIAHRLSTIRNAKRIIVLGDSGVAEQGTHAELMALRGVYANLCDLQLRL